ncbi:MAG: galactose oxidase early set domain-containing protein [Phycisphaerae bacterium]
MARKRHPLALALGIAALLCALSTSANADFVPGRLYVTHAGDRQNPTSPADQILEVDPLTGSYSVFYQFAAKEGLNSPVFTPGSDLRVARFRQSEVLQFDNGAAQPTVALTNVDGVHFPGDLDYDRFGDLHSFNYFSASQQCTYLIFKPPYFFYGPRPTIVTAPSDVIYDSPFNVDLTIPSGTTLTNVWLIRPGSVTHSTNFDQRLVELDWALNDVPPGSPPQISVSPPASGNEAPPGYYTLFVVVKDSQNRLRPSVAKFIRVRSDAL